MPFRDLGFSSLVPSFWFSALPSSFPKFLDKSQEQSQRVNTVSCGDPGQTAAGLPAPDTHHGLSLDPFAEKTVCCLLLEVRRLSLGVLNGFEVLLAEFWPLRQALVFTCTNDVLELEGGDAGEGEGLHIDPCLLSAEEERRELSTSRVAGEPHTLTHTQIHKRQKEKRLSCRVGTPKPQL